MEVVPEQRPRPPSGEALWSGTARWRWGCRDNVVTAGELDQSRDGEEGQPGCRPLTGPASGPRWPGASDQVSSKLQFAEVEPLVQNVWENDSDISLKGEPDGQR